MITSDVENYPGYADGIMGPEMMADFRRQAERFETEFVTDNVTKVDFSQRPFRVWVEDTEYTARSVIVSTGASARWLGLESEDRLKGHGVSACATCDAAFFRERNVYVVGGGDSAFEEALFLTKFASEVHLVHRRDEFRASRIMVDRAKANPKITFILDAHVKEIVGNEKVHVVRYEHGGQDKELRVGGVFIFVGFVPNSKLFKLHVDHDAGGYILTDRNMQTSVEGIWAVGDVRAQLTKQIATAVGDGTTAAVAASMYITALKDAARA